jgi:hypothetical protein
MQPFSEISVRRSSESVFHLQPGKIVLKAHVGPHQQLATAAADDRKALSDTSRIVILHAAYTARYEGQPPIRPGGASAPDPPRRCYAAWRRSSDNDDDAAATGRRG